MPHASPLCRLGMCVFLLSLGSALHAQTFTTFDVNNSISTNPAAINSSGAVTGSFQDANGTHGFVRQPNGSITPFDVPGSTGTNATGIDAAGQIVGSSNGPVASQGFNSHQTRGFLRSSTGQIQLFDCAQFDFDFPTATFTDPVAINDKGEIVGSCDWIEDIDSFFNAFAMQASAQSGAISLSSELGQTNATGINNKGEVVGWYDVVGEEAQHGLILAPNGKQTSFDAVSNDDTFEYQTRSQAVNASGTVTGDYSTDGGMQYHGFIRDTSGNITSFDVQNSTNTNPIAINADGFILGSYTDSAFATHGFTRAADGTITSFDVPGATSTTPTGMSSSGKIVGSYTDASGNVHGFIRNKAGDGCTVESQPVTQNNQTLYQLTATVNAIAPATGAPSGKVTFWDSAFWQINLGSAAVVNGQATLTVDLPAQPNPQFVRAVYAGNDVFKGCTTQYLPIFQYQ